jgi:hypothetical protein
VQGAWEEFVDQMVDFGQPLPKSQTRLELVSDFGLPSAVRLAELSDQAAFSYEDPSPEEVEEAWQLVNAEIAAQKQGMKFLKRVISKLSLRSFMRHVDTTEQLDKFRGALNFKQAASRYEGSPLAAFLRFIWRQLVSLVPKK